MGLTLNTNRLRWANVKTHAAMKCLKDECDPGPLLEMSAQTLKTIRGPVPAGTYFFHILNYIDASAAAGKYGFLLKLPAELHPDRLFPSDATNHTQYELALSHGYAAEGMYAQAAEAQNRAMEHFKRGPHTSANRYRLQWRLSWNGSALRLHLGELDGLGDTLPALVTSASCAYETVLARLLLGRFHLSSGRPEEARRELEYVRDHGGRLYAREEAADLLRELDVQPPTPERRVRDAHRSIMGAVEVLERSCDPLPLLSACQAALEDEAVQQTPSTAATARLSLCAALIDLGRYGEARAKLDRFDPGGETNFQITKLAYATLIEIGEGCLEEAARGQNEAMALFNAEPSQSCRALLMRNGCQLQILLGQLDGVEERLEWLLDAAENEFDRVAVRMLLARYFLAAGRPQEAEPHLTYVAAHGGRLHHRAEALRRNKMHSVTPG